ncbi:fimbrial biogenesis chaperone [Chitinophaga silvatica]|uniref:fimbrial biogenesis chaperone n=1 Tax=Chitinophaga silvatica TaxID=2282649 RepID=UPI0011C1CB47|nr:molecular chaperone [Chitinophaga silvatica]
MSTCLTLLATLFFEDGSAQGNLLVTPVRVIFDGQKRSEDLNIANLGKDSARYVISLIEIRMKRDGTFEEINEPDSGQAFASKYLRFFPHSVVLAPNEAQIIKLQVTNTADLKPGEFRSHLYFRAVPDENYPLTTKNENDSTGIQVKLVPIFGISIPVIIRSGETRGSVRLSDITVKADEKQGPFVSMLFNRFGNASVYGDIEVSYISPQGRTTQVALANGVAVYTPNLQRLIRIPLTNKNDINYHVGKLKITYTAKTSKESEQLAFAEVPLK